MTGPEFKGAGEGGTAAHPLRGQVVFKVRGEQSGGRLTAFETVVGPDEGPPLHSHANEEETLYVLEGEVRFRLQDELRTGGAGSFVFIPRGLPHTFQNVGAGPARILIHFSPAGMERFFDAFAALDPPDPDAFARLGPEAGMAVLGPPLAQSHPV
jgi:quercetin dioxygenase-like cupin family protein